MLSCRRREEEEEEPVTSTTGTQTETDIDGAESFEMVQLHDDVETIYLHPVATPSAVHVAPSKPSTSHAAAAAASMATRSSTTTTTMMATTHPEPLKRLTTEEIAERIHSRGPGTQNVGPG